jgi:tRNA (guanine-N7-)-methyltransferase
VALAKGMKEIKGPNPLADERRGHRQIRSFVLREGRLTPGQLSALEKLWPLYGLENSSEPFDFESVFGRSAPVILEIGFGNGESLAQAAAESPDQDFVGIEVHRPGVGHLLQLIDHQGLKNLRIVCADAVSVLEHRVVDNSLAGLRIYFPDPWPKKRHHKRRIVQAPFITLATRKLCDRGVLHLATDWENYAEQMMAVVEAQPGLRNQAGTGGFSERPDWRAETKFERRGKRLGHGVWDLIFSREGALPVSED